MDYFAVYTKRNIYDYLVRPEKKFDKEYSEERQKIRQYSRKDDLATKKDVGVIDWGYFLKPADEFDLGLRAKNPLS